MLSAGLISLAITKTGQGQAKPANAPLGPSVVVYAEPEPLLLDLLYEGIRLDNSLAGLTDSLGRRFLPMRAVGAALGCRLHVDPAKKTVAGFISVPSDRVELNGDAGKCKRGTHSFAIEPWQCFQRDGDLYVEADLLARWAGFRFLWRLNRSEVEVWADRPLPVLSRLAQRRILEGKAEEPYVAPSLSKVQTPYALFTAPVIDAQLYSTVSNSRSTDPPESRFAVQGTGDLLFMGARYRFIGSTRHDPAAMLLTFGREDAGGKLLGSLRATQISFGDVAISPVAFLDRTRNGLGVSISNFPLSGTDNSNSSQVDGKTVPASMIELYRGDELLGTALADAEGKFSFSRVPLVSGPNELRVVVTTPDGDVHEERRTLYGEANGPKKGQTRYVVSIGEIGKSLLNAPLEIFGEDRRRRVAVGEYQWGLSPSSWLSFTLADTDSGNVDGRYAGMGLHSWIGETLFRLQGLVSQTGNGVVSAGVSRSLGNSTVSFDETHAVNGFAAIASPEIVGDAKSVSRFRLDGVMGARANQVSYGFGIDRFDGSDPTTVLRGRLSGFASGLYVSNSFAYRLNSSGTDGIGILQFRRQFGSTTGRLDVGYDFGPEQFLQTIHLSADRRISQGYRLRLGVDYDANRDAAFDTTAGLYRMFGPLALGVSIGVDSAGRAKANLLLSVGLAQDTPDGNLGLARAGAGQSGGVSVRVFLDRNLSGKYDAGDTLLPDVGLRIDGRTSRVKTGAKGTCLLGRMSPNQAVALTLDEDSFSDPCWIAGGAGVSVTPRAGHTVNLDFPVVEGGEIEGKAVGMDGLAGSTAELVMANGAVLQTSILDDDGSYVFSRVYPGEYKIRLIDLSNHRLGGLDVKVTAGAMLKGCDLKITKQLFAYKTNPAHGRG